MDERRAPVVAVVGAGLSGTLAAIHLLRRARHGLRITLIERTGDFGPGLAYSTEDEQHLLNVPAERMSAFGDAPSHFREWAERQLGRPVSPDAFLPRRLYGDYLRDLLDEEQARAFPGCRVRRVRGQVTDVRQSMCCVELSLSAGERLRADRAILALGWIRSAPLPQLPPDPAVVMDPLAPGALAGAPAARTTLVVGTGLTAIDATLSSCTGDAGGRVVAVSRRGLLPQAHLPGLRAPAPPPSPAPTPLTLERLEQHLADHRARMLERGFDWRDVVDGLRPEVPELWGLLSDASRRRLLHGRIRQWDVCRHRMAPQVATRLAELRRQGRFSVIAGRVASVRRLSDGVEVGLAVDDGVTKSLVVERVLLCAGAGGDVHDSPDPLVRSLLSTGQAAADDLRLGLRATRQGALVGADGTAGRLYTLGPPRRGELLESTALCEIREQASRLADELCASLGLGTFERRRVRVPAGGSTARSRQRSR